MTLPVKPEFISSSKKNTSWISLRSLLSAIEKIAVRPIPCGSVCMAIISPIKDEVSRKKSAALFNN